LKTIDIEGAQLSCVAFSPDNKTLFVASGSGPITAWDVESGAKSRSFSEPGDGVAQVVVSCDGRLLAGDIPSPPDSGAPGGTV